MAIIHTLERLDLERETTHTEASATYAIVNGKSGKMLQIDTYGSADRKIAGKKSQSIRLSPKALLQLKEIIDQII